MADLNEEKLDVYGGVELNNEEKATVGTGVYGGVEIESNENVTNGEANVEETTLEAGTIRNTALPTKVKSGFWTRFKAFWLQDIDWKKEIKVELTPYQQKVEDEINEFLHQEITWEKVKKFLFREVKFF